MVRELLKVENLYAGYGNEKIKTVVKNATFSVNEGEILGIVGESGSGKTTLLQALLSVKGFAAKIVCGNVFFKGRDFLTMSEKERRALYGDEIAFIFQNPLSSFNPIRKIGVQFIEALQLQEKISSADARKRVEDVLISLNLKDTERILNSYPFQLSGGMGQRVAIAFAVMCYPELILADEPTSALDVSVQKQVVEELLEMRKNYGTAIVMITHNIGVIAHMADNIAVMYKGEIVEYGKRENVLYNPEHPYTRALIAAIPGLGGKLPKAGGFNE